jgi:PAS domain S-box-containing protein
MNGSERVVRVRGDEADVEDAITDLEDADAVDVEPTEGNELSAAFRENAPFPIIRYDINGEIVRANGAAVAFAKADNKDELVGNDIGEFFPADRREGMFERIGGVLLEDEAAPAMEYELEDFDGETRHATIAGVPARHDGFPAGVAVVNDITERTRLSRRLRNERDRFAAIYENLGEPALEVRFEGDTAVAVTANDAFVDTFGVRPEDTDGAALVDRIVPDSPESREKSEAIVRRSQAGEAVERELHMETVDGERDFLFRSAPYETDDGERRAHGIFIDISERKERQRALRRQNERLESIAGAMSHDLRNPLNVAQGHLDLHEDSEDDLAPVGGALDRMEGIVEDVLTMAREGGSVEETEQVTLDHLARDAWEAVPTEAATLRAKGSVRLGANPSRLQRLLENLFRNAVEHVGEDVTVEVAGLEAGRGFYVADDGPGVPVDRRETVFEPGHTTAVDGTGFGLAIVEQIATAHGWDPALSEASAGGARFEFRAD